MQAQASKRPRRGSFVGRSAASESASRAARGSSRKSGTRCEVILLKAVRRLGLRPKVNVATLAGKPDLVFPEPKVVVFCDGDFWHGRNFASRKRKLARGHNAPYWVTKISGNIVRDRRQNAKLRREGWRVLRYWETDIKTMAASLAAAIFGIVNGAR